MLVKELFENSELAKRLAIKLEDLQISPKVLDSLKNDGILTIEQLCFKRKTEILAIDGIGKFSLEELEQLLADLGLTFMIKQ